LGDKAKKINWVVSDITEFQPDTTFDVWHDRATFHFLTTGEQVAKYLDTARSSVSGFLIIGTFSDNGPEKCSGLPIANIKLPAITYTKGTGGIYFRSSANLTRDRETRRP